MRDYKGEPPVTLQEMYEHIQELLLHRPELAQSNVVAGNPNGKHGFDVVDFHIPGHLRSFVLGTDGLPHHFEDALP